jgi:hypothetical protein
MGPVRFLRHRWAGISVGARVTVDPFGTFPRPNNVPQSGVAACVGGAAEVGATVEPLSGGCGSGSLFAFQNGPNGMETGSVDTTGGSVGATPEVGLGANGNVGFRVGIGGFGPGLSQ